MFLPGWSIWCILLTLRLTACVLETSEYDSHEVICSQGLSECTMRDEMFLTEAENTVDVLDLKPNFKLCCKNTTTCTLCLEIDTELYIKPEKTTEDEGYSGSDEEDYSEEMRSPKASVTVCYYTAATMPICKKVEFTVNHAALTQQNLAKVSFVITKPEGFHFGNQVFVYPSKSILPRCEAVAPSLEEVCSQQLRRRVPKCLVPTVTTVINQEMNQVKLQFEGRKTTLPSVCVQYEQDGICQSWNTTTIPLYSVAPCLCLQVWDEDDQRSARSVHCPFNNTDFQHIFQKNPRQNVSVSVILREVRSLGTMLFWNLSAPCRLQGDVWVCYGGNSCRQKNTVSQQQINGTWRQNSKGHWENAGVFENIEPQRSPCVMVKIKGMEHEMGPFCPKDTGREHWSLLVVGVVLLVCLTVLMFYFLHDFVKKWVWSWRHGGFVKLGRKGHVVLLSPPDVDDGVSESVRQLWSLLCDQGFSVSVDMWSRKEQCSLGPLPWLHSQLLKINSLGGRALLVLNCKALERTEEWTHSSKDAMETKGEEKLPAHQRSPYHDMFTASLFLIQADKQLGKAGERFVLVKFDSHTKQTHSSDRSLPELLQGLPLFQFPSQTQSLLAELTVVPAERTSGEKTWTT
uniref:Interleukin-17 receptor C-like n=1 Tax=Acanthochromis polyacanthus TaxID=80966 RepID=A0A3Q1EGA2_9TELE